MATNQEKHEPMANQRETRTYRSIDNGRRTYSILVGAKKKWTRTVSSDATHSTRIMDTNQNLTFEKKDGRSGKRRRRNPGEDDSYI